MPAIWVVSPIINHNGVRRAKVATLIDTGVPPELVDDVEVDENDQMQPRTRIITYPYTYSSVTDGIESLAMVWGVNFQPIIQDPDCLIVLDDIADDSPQSNSGARISRYGSRGTRNERDVLDTEIARRGGVPQSANATLGERLTALGITFDPSFALDAVYINPSEKRLNKVP